MTDHPFPDDLLDAVLGARAGEAAPPDLRRAIVAAALNDPARRAASRRAAISIRLLAVAAVLTLAGGALVVTGALRPRAEDGPAPSRALATPLEAVVAPVPSASMPSRQPCPTMRRLPIDAGPVEPYVPSAAAPRPAGDLVHVEPALGGLKLQLRRVGGATIGDGFVPSATGIAASPDGRWVALDVDGTSLAACGDVLLVSVPDGTFRRPFTAGILEHVDGAAWSRDGGTLYAVHRTVATGPLAPPPDRGSVWAWDRATDTSSDLGAPCDGCAVEAAYPQPDGSVVAVFLADRCHLNGRCGRGVGTLRGGAWTMVVTPSAAPDLLTTSSSAPLGVSADGALVVDASDRIGLIALDGSGRVDEVQRPCCIGMIGATVSPDGSLVAVLVATETGPRSMAALFDTRLRQWRTGDSFPGAGGQVLSAAWAPDSTAVAWNRLANLDGPPELLVVAADGRVTTQRPLDGEGPIGWLPAAP